MIRCIIIDDDVFIQDLLRDKLDQYVPEVEVTGVAGSGEEGLKKINIHQPDLIFLDVEMADMTGFEMLEKLERVDFQTIFITSYSHYAIKAIRFNALDYLLKPIDLGELRRAIAHFKKRLKTNEGTNNIQRALINLRTKKAADQTLVLHTQDGELRLQLKSIVRIEGERNYSYIHLVNQKKKLASKTLADLEDLLNGKGFFRCHKSHLVNFIHIKSYSNRFTIILSDETEIPVSRRRKESFQDWYNSYQG